jgi:hypothetical protein
VDPGDGGFDPGDEGLDDGGVDPGGFMPKVGGVTGNDGMCRDPVTGVELEPAVGEVADVCAGLIGAGGVCVRRRAPLPFDEFLKLDLRLIPPPPPPPRAKAGVSVETKNIAANSAELAMSLDAWIIGVSPCLLIVCNQALTFRAISRGLPRDSWVVAQTRPWIQWRVSLPTCLRRLGSFFRFFW